MKPTDDRWKPVLRGDVYCSPGCGRGCTAEEFARATSAGNLLAKRMGDGWEAYIWENLGWHFSARFGDTDTRIHSSGKGSYTAFLHDARGRQHAVMSAKTPKRALALALETVREKHAALSDLIAAITPKSAKADGYKEGK